MTLQSRPVIRKRSIGAATPSPPPVVESPSVTHRWWQVAVDGTGSLPALAGLDRGVVWRGAVDWVPCELAATGETGRCPCSLHAPADELAMVRSLASVVVSGHARLLSGGRAGTTAPFAMVALDGTLELVAWCGGDQDGFTLTRCPQSPLWIVAASGLAWGFCRRHLGHLPASLKHRRIRRDSFVEEVRRAFATRYGLVLEAV